MENTYIYVWIKSISDRWPNLIKLDKNYLFAQLLFTHTRLFLNQLESWPPAWNILVQECMMPVPKRVIFISHNYLNDVEFSKLGMDTVSRTLRTRPFCPVQKRRDIRYKNLSPGSFHGGTITYPLMTILLEGLKYFSIVDFGQTRLFS